MKRKSDDLLDLINRLSLDWDDTLTIGIDSESNYWVRLENIQTVPSGRNEATAPTLRQCLEEILKQTGRDKEED